MFILFIITIQNKNKVERSEVAELFIAARGNLYQYAHCLTWDFDRADDLLQETAFKVLINAHQLTEKNGFLKWARRIMHNIFISNSKHEERHQSVDDFAPIISFTNKGPFSQNSFISSSSLLVRFFITTIVLSLIQTIKHTLLQLFFLVDTTKNYIF